MSVWPKAATIAAAVAGRLAQVLNGPPVGANYRGLQSAYPWITLAVVKETLERYATCGRCGDVEDEPPLPASAQAPGAPPTPLFAPGTNAHALFVLSWLHRYTAKHSECVENSLVCGFCASNVATCMSPDESRPEYGPACDQCCAHGNDHCRPLKP